MFEIIFIIIIYLTVIKISKRVKENGGSLKGTIPLPNITVTTSNQQNNRPQNTGAQNGNLNNNPNPNPYVSQNNGKGAVPTYSNVTKPSVKQPRTVQQPQSVQTSQKAIQEAKEDGHSTTAYLMEKAEADAREHAKEKYEEQKRLHETRGGLAVAERYLEGDTIPSGKRCINCGYCGAENLIPMIPRTKYSCYFCREPLG